MKQGQTRILTALVGIPFVLGLVWLGGWYFFGLITLIALGAQFELVRMLQSSKWQVSLLWTLILGGTVVLRPVLPMWEGWMLFVTLLFAVFQLRSGPDRIQERMASSILCAIYPVLMISFLIDIQEAAHFALGEGGAFWLMLLLLGLIWATDTGAYYTGKSIGKRKLAPSISPNKTWEGTIGGLVLAFIVGSVFKTTLLPELSWIDVTVLAFLGGAWGQMGDLLESAFKRSVGVKDSGSVLPGHGGLLDRFDSLIFTAPAYYLYLFYVTDLIGRSF
jgi:phosphatidate cytidylyltransferase